MKVVHCPIDTSLSFTQANKLIRDLKPAHLLVPDVYLHPPKSAPLRSDLVIQGKRLKKINDKIVRKGCFLISLP